jgi:hypothetical protein
MDRRTGPMELYLKHVEVEVGVQRAVRRYWKQIFIDPLWYTLARADRTRVESLYGFVGIQISAPDLHINE